MSRQNSFRGDAVVVVFVYTAACSLQLAARASLPLLPPLALCSGGTRDHSSDQNKMNEVGGAGGAATKAREGSPPPSAHASGVSPVITSLTTIGLGR